MTLAYDRTTGALVGQVTGITRVIRGSDPDTPDWIHLLEGEPTLTLLIRDGAYRSVPASSVRLEKVR